MLNSIILIWAPWIRGWFGCIHFNTVYCRLDSMVDMQLFAFTLLFIRTDTHWNHLITTHAHTLKDWQVLDPCRHTRKHAYVIDPVVLTSPMSCQLSYSSWSKWGGYGCAVTFRSKDHHSFVDGHHLLQKIFIVRLFVVLFKKICIMGGRGIVQICYLPHLDNCCFSSPWIKLLNCPSHNHTIHGLFTSCSFWREGHICLKIKAIHQH